MASIVKRKNKYSVVYTYEDEKGNKRQKWETFNTNTEAKKRKAQVEYEQQTGTFIVPSATTVAELLEEYCSVYGVNNWSMSTYDAKKSLMYNYIIPLIGDIKLDDCTPRLMDKFYQSLLNVKSKVTKYRKPTTTYLSPKTVNNIHKFLRSAFNQAVKWELMSRNPVLNATLPKTETKKREIWTAETLLHALEVCDDDILALAINLSFSCSLRMGEMLGLTWDCVDISEQAIKNNTAYIYVNKELQRVNREVMETLSNKDIIKVFPNLMGSRQTILVLKTPKTQTSVRKIFLPSTVANMLVERKNQLDEIKDLLGSEFADHNLVFCHQSGRPMEGQVINRSLKELIRKNDLPDIVFHSFRHASITYKLKWNGGDMKSVQGDSGHARMDMVADVYSHIIDEDRRFNAQKFDEQFYKTKGLRDIEEGTTAPMPKFEAAVDIVKKEKAESAPIIEESIIQKEEDSQEPSSDENAVLLAKLLSNPETAALLKALDMIQEYVNNPTGSPVELICDKKCYVLEGALWKGQLAEITDSIVFIDEGNDFIKTEEFAGEIQKTDNYYVIVTRESLPTLPYSVEEIYGIRTSGKYGTLKQSYHEFYRIYGTLTREKDIKPELVITEDSNSGYQFFDYVCRENHLRCETMNGKSNVFHYLRDHKNEKILVIADGAAFGSEIDRVLRLIEGYENVALYLPESFEWLILSAGILKNNHVLEILDAPYDYVDSEAFFSWERFFTAVLIDETKDTYLTYMKKRLNPAYLQDVIKETILEKIEKISLTWKR